MKLCSYYLALLIFAVLSCSKSPENYTLEGSLKKWHSIELSFEGPFAGEQDSLNPFLAYRLDVHFQHKDRTIVVPGFFAADGNAAESSAETGNIWRVRFTPDQVGEWTFICSFRKGENIAVSDDPNAGEAVSFDGLTGSFSIEESDKKGRDFRANGMLKYTGEHYLRYAETGKAFLKAGADSPENFLGYQEFDNTYYGGDGEWRSGEASPNAKLHAYEPHIQDWREGDPNWQNGKGKGIIGALNYLASTGMNSVYMLTQNVGGDGKDVFPWTDYDSAFQRFDVSKLAQWEMVFSHMDQLGIQCHFMTQETENELLLDGGETGLNRKLYYRELIARFAHHLGVCWNLGEENGVAPWIGVGQSDQQRKDMATYIKQTDPYDHLVVLHTLPNYDLRDSMLRVLLGFPYLDGPSLQTMPNIVHEQSLIWRKRSAEAGRKWVVCSDEIGPHTTGAKPDEADPEHNEIRHQVLWGNLMAGGAGVEWYFGYEYAHDDLGCEDWRSRKNLWEQSRIAIDFFHQYLPFDEMEPADEILSDTNAYAFVKGDDLFVAYLPFGAAVQLKSEAVGKYQRKWFNPRSGGALIDGGVLEKNAGEPFESGVPPADPGRDWVVVIQRAGA